MQVTSGGPLDLDPIWARSTAYDAVEDVHSDEAAVLRYYLLNDVPKLLREVVSLRAQLAAVKQLHQPIDVHILGLRCRWCTDSDGVRFAWPCPTARAASRASDEAGDQP